MESGTLVINSMPNVDALIVLVCIGLPNHYCSSFTLKANRTSLWHKFSQMSVLKRERSQMETTVLINLKKRENAYKVYKVITILKFEQEALLFQIFL